MARAEPVLAQPSSIQFSSRLESANHPECSHWRQLEPPVRPKSRNFQSGRETAHIAVAHFGLVQLSREMT